MSSSINHTVTDIEAMPVARKLAAELLDANDVDRQTCHDIVLIVQELAVNGFVHAGATEVEVSVSVESPTVEIKITHGVDATPVIPDFPSPMPPPTARSGRGLPIVDRLSARRRTYLSGDRLITSCSVAIA